jgi:divinyl chlorophyllide a 8-vinyl-reductase
VSSGRVLVAGASGYIGRHVVRELQRRGIPSVALVRPGSRFERDGDAELSGVEIRYGHVTDPVSVTGDGFRGERFAGVISCIASRTGASEDAWQVDCRANEHLLAAAEALDAGVFVLLSAICVQRPRLAFQHAKLAFERRLMASSVNWSIVRPTAFYKSVAGQLARVLAGKRFLMLGAGDGPACKPISEADLAAFLTDCLEDESLQGRILPVGGPDEALTVRERAELIFDIAGRQPRYLRVPLTVLDAAIASFDLASRLRPRLADKAEFARIARYYATESMLLFDVNAGAYDAEATPSYGTRRLSDFYRNAIRHGMTGQELGDHALF